MKKLNMTVEQRNVLDSAYVEKVETSSKPSKLQPSKMKSLKNINQSQKVNNQAQLFIAKITNDLEQYDDDDLNLNYKILADVYNKAVNNIVYGTKEEREHAILFSVKTLMSKYFRDDDNLDMLLECIRHTPKLNKSSFLKRVAKRFMNWLLLKKN